MNLKKRKKQTRMHGTHTHKRGAKKKARGSGHRGGVGMAGTGKKADHKKTLITKLFGNKYFGKSKTLRKPVKPRIETINLSKIQKNLQSFIKKGLAKKTSSGYELNLSEFKILAQGELKDKITIIAKAASKQASEKAKKSGSIIELKN